MSEAHAEPNAGAIAARPARAELVAGAPVSAIVPRTIEEAFRFAKAIYVSGVAPDSYTMINRQRLPEEQIMSRIVGGIMKGAEVGLPPMAAMSQIAIINNRFCVYGDGATAIIQGKGHLESMKIEEIGTVPSESAETTKFADDYGWRVTMLRKGQSEPYVGQFTVGDAKRAKLWMDLHRQPWIQHPKRQIFWRAFHRAANPGFSDDLMGLAIRELLEELPPEPIKTNPNFLDDTPAQQSLTTPEEPMMSGAMIAEFSNMLGTPT